LSKSQGEYADDFTVVPQSEAMAVTNLIGNGVATIVVGKWCGQADGARLIERLASGHADTPGGVDAVVAVS
jgi:hypothetical protein